MPTIPEEKGNAAWRAQMPDMVRQTVAHMERYTAALIASGCDRDDVIQSMNRLEDMCRRIDEEIRLRALAIWRLRRQLF